FVNRNGTLVDQTNAFGFENTDGWYHAVATGDFNNDGHTDIVTGNHGLNSRFKASATEPVSLYINDFDQNGTVEQILTRFQNGVSYPMVLRQDLVAQLPGLRKKYLHYKDYRGQTISDIFTAEQLERAIILNARSFETTLWLNTGLGSFERKTLPVEVQFSPVYAILINDFDEDGNADILMGGNLYRAKPETGIYDGSYGILLKGDGRGNFTALPSVESGICIKGEIRSLRNLRTGGGRVVLGARNNDAPVVLQY
ncbi:MAG TPA: FG-GAP repeat protein, partial [Cyclobacteriaceae bacterium]